jgi:pSer/pThr/pTyr-binding forkhead associated (FHA) protein
MDFSQLLWIIPVVLAVVAALQIVYLLILSIAPAGRRRPVKQPNAPIMPTTPQGGLNPAPAYTPAPKVTSGKMVVVSGLANMAEIPLPNNNFGIGRFYHPENNILVALDEKSISRRHATFMGDDNLREYYLTDTSSSYGTSIRKDNQLQLLTPGKRERVYNEDVVQFGNSVTVRLVLPGDTRAAATRL